jgi:hypothetical protein
VEQQRDGNGCQGRECEVLEDFRRFFLLFCLFLWLLRKAGLLAEFQFHGPHFSL